MTWEPLHPAAVLVDSYLDDGTTTVSIWRTEIEINGRMVDATPWCSSPARASSLGRDLKQTWSGYRRWTGEEVAA